MRLPHAPLEHHCRRPGRDVSTNRSAQSGAAHSRTRSASGLLSSSTASRAIVASIASTGRAATHARSLLVVSCGARGARAAHWLSSSGSPGCGSTPGRASRLIASRSTRPAASCRPETRGGSRSMPVPTIQRARSSGSSSRSNDRRQRSPTVATKSRHSRPLFQWKRSSSGGSSSMIATLICDMSITHVAARRKSSQRDNCPIGTTTTASLAVGSSFMSAGSSLLTSRPPAPFFLTRRASRSRHGRHADPRLLAS